MLTFGTIISLYIVMIPSVLLQQYYIPLIVMPVALIITIGTMMGWMYSVGTGLNRIIPDDIKMKTGFFRFTNLFPLIYLVILPIFIIIMIYGIEKKATHPAYFTVIIPFHLFCMFCMFYNLWFIAKVFKTAEQQRALDFSDYAGEFFMMWFYIVGIWIIQPKINKMYEDNKEKIDGR